MARGCWAPATRCRGGGRAMGARRGGARAGGGAGGGRRGRAGGDAAGRDGAERVRVVRSRELAEGHARTPEQNPVKAEAAALRLTPPRGRGRRLFGDEAALRQALAEVWE